MRNELKCGHFHLMNPVKFWCIESLKKCFNDALSSHQNQRLLVIKVPQKRKNVFLFRMNKALSFFLLMWRMALLHLFFNATQTLFLCVHGITPKLRWFWCIFWIAFLHRNEPNIFTHWNENNEGKHVKHLVLDNKLRHIIIFLQFSNIHRHKLARTANMHDYIMEVGNLAHFIFIFCFLFSSCCLVYAIYDVRSVDVYFISCEFMNVFMCVRMFFVGLNMASMSLVRYSAHLPSWYVGGSLEFVSCI